MEADTVLSSLARGLVREQVCLFVETSYVPYRDRTS